MSEQQRPKCETDNCRHRLIKYCQGQGLDIGCSFGRISTNAIGIDLYSPFADMRADARDLKVFPSEHFDFVYSSHLLEELENTEATLKEWLRVLKPGGYMVLYQADRDYYYPLDDPRCNKSHKHHFIWEELWAIFEKIGGLKLIQNKRYGPDYGEWSFELVIQKIKKGITEEASIMNQRNFSLNMIFWYNEEPDRLRNINFCWPQLKKLVSFLNGKGLETSCNLYDFSETKILDFPETIHISTKKGEFKKAWKINRILEKTETTFFSLFDSDVFFDERDFQKIYEIFCSSNHETFTVFNLRDIRNLSINFENNTYDSNSFNGKFRTLQALGGAYIIGTKAITEVGGFDERFLIWGGEDEDLRNRIVKNGLKMWISDIPLYHLPHPKHGYEEVNTTPQYHAQLHILHKDPLIKRNFLKRDN